MQVTHKPPFNVKIMFDFNKLFNNIKTILSFFEIALLINK